MRSRADQFNAAIMRLKVRARPFEAWQNRVVNLDGATIQVFAQRRRQYLSVTSMHDQINTLFNNDGADFRPLKELGRRRYRQVHDRNVVARRELVVIHVISHDTRNVNGQVTALVTEQQIV